MLMRALLLALCMLLPGSVLALTIEGVEIRQVIPATKDTPELKLKGASVRRAYAIVDTYIGQLYLENASLNEEDILQTDQGRRMVFHVLSSRVSARRFANAINEGLSINLSKDESKRIKPRIDQLIGLFDHKFVKGTIGYIEWLPEQGVSRIVLDEEIKGTVTGKDLNDALLKIWIGEHPVSERFKRQVLGEDSD